MRLFARRLVQLVVVVILATLFTFSLLRLLPGRRRRRRDPVRHEGADGSSSTRTTGSTSRSSSSTSPGSATSHTVTSARTTPNNLEVSDKIRNALPVSLQLMLYAQLMALAVAIPLGVLTGYRVGNEDRHRDQRGCLRAARAPELRARTRARVLRRGAMATPLTLARPDPRRRDTRRAGSKACSGGRRATSATTSPRCSCRRSRWPRG